MIGIFWYWSKIGGTMAVKKIDWFNVLAAYLIDEKQSVRDVAKMFNLSYSTVRNRAQRDHWFRHRVLLHHRAREKMRLIMVYEDAKTEAIRQALSGKDDLEGNYSTLW